MRKCFKTSLTGILIISICAFFCGCLNWKPTVFDDTVKNVGIYLNEPSEIEALQVKPDIIGWYEAWGTQLANTKAQVCIRDRITPLINWQPDDYTLTDISEGKQDDLIRSYLSEINEVFGENTVLIRLAHEMESNTPNATTWYPWQYYGGEQDYINMWRHVVTIGREVAPNVRWIWSPNRINEESAKWYPGDDYVDYVSITLNRRSDQKYSDFADYYIQEGRSEYFKQFNKKVLLSEVAYAGSDEAAKGEYMKSIFDYVEQDEQICGVVFFNEDISKDRRYRFTDNESCMNTWYEGIQRLHNRAEELPAQEEPSNE